MNGRKHRQMELKVVNIQLTLNSLGYTMPELTINLNKSSVQFLGKYLSWEIIKVTRGDLGARFGNEPLMVFLCVYSNTCFF